MPEIKYFVVTQTREVKIAANSVIEAGQIATKVFQDTSLNDNQLAAAAGVSWGHPTTQPRITDLSVREDY